MPETTASVCTDPSVGRLLNDALTGSLRAKKRASDRRLFEEHMTDCSKCRKAVIDHLNETVTIPALRQFATEHGVSFEEVCEAFTYGIEKTRREANE